MPQPRSTVHPETRVPIRRGEDHVVIRPWSLGTRHLLYPVLEGIIGKVGGLRETLAASRGGNADLAVLGHLLREAETEVTELVRITLGWTPEEMDERLFLEDLPALAQAVMTTCVITADGGGALGKALGMLGGLSRPAAAPGVPEAAPTTSGRSTPSNASAPKPPPSPSSPGAGEPTSSGSAGR